MTICMPKNIANQILYMNQYYFNLKQTKVNCAVFKVMSFVIYGYLKSFNSLENIFDT